MTCVRGQTGSPHTVWPCSQCSVVHRTPHTPYLGLRDGRWMGGGEGDTTALGCGSSGGHGPTPRSTSRRGIGSTRRRGSGSSCSCRRASCRPSSPSGCGSCTRTRTRRCGCGSRPRAGSRGALWMRPTLRGQSHGVAQLSSDRLDGASSHKRPHSTEHRDRFRGDRGTHDTSEGRRRRRQGQHGRARGVEAEVGV